IFEKAIAESDDYEGAFDRLVMSGADAEAIYDALVLDDIRAACDVLRPAYDAAHGADGFVSIEVSPLLASSTAETLAEAQRLWKAVDRANLMVKIPATPEGIPAVRAATALG